MSDPWSRAGLRREVRLSSLTVTLVYAVYAVGVLASLVLAGHVSDWYGRRAGRDSPDAAVPIAAGIFLDIFNVFLLAVDLFGGRDR